MNPCSRSNRGRCRGALCSVLIGIAGVVLLATNEGNYLIQQKTISEGQKHLVEVLPNQPIDFSNEGKLVHVIGSAETPNVLTDPTFGVAQTNVLKLQRVVQMFQWVELEEYDREGNRQYEQQWKDTIIDSSEFQNNWEHTNPSSMLYSSSEWIASQVTVGNYLLSQEATDKMSWYQPISEIVNVTDIPLSSIRDTATSIGNGLFLGKGEPLSPNVGDLKVTFQVVPESTVSILARQTENSLTVFTGHAHGSVLLVEQGTHDVSEMLAHFENDLVGTTWTFRVIGFVLLYLFLRLMTLPFEALAEHVPVFGHLVGAGSRLIAFGVASALWALVIALAWLWYRPILSLMVLFLLGGLSFFIHRKNKDLRREIASVLGDNGAATREYEIVPTAIATTV